MAVFQEMLGVSRDADKEEIKIAYRRLAQVITLTANKEPGAEERFREINRLTKIAFQNQEIRARSLWRKLA